MLTSQLQPCVLTCSTERGRSTGMVSKGTACRGRSRGCIWRAPAASARLVLAFTAHARLLLRKGPRSSTTTSLLPPVASCSMIIQGWPLASHHCTHRQPSNTTCGRVEQHMYVAAAGSQEFSNCEVRLRSPHLPVYVGQRVSLAPFAVAGAPHLQEALHKQPRTHGRIVCDMLLLLLLLVWGLCAVVSPHTPSSWRLRTQVSRRC